MISVMSDASPSSANEAQRQVSAARQGDPAQLYSIVRETYSELRSIAQRLMRREREMHTLQTTALVNEFVAAILGRRVRPPESPREFLAIATRAMRNILIDHARARAAIRRGGGKQRIPLDKVDQAASESPQDFLAVEDAISRLEEKEPQAAELVRLRFFAGLEVDEAAAVLGISASTALREWAYARALLAEVLGEDEEPHSKHG